MKHMLLVLSLVALTAAMMAPSDAAAQTRNVTFIVNAATVPDTVSATYTLQIRGGTPPLTWGNDTGGQLEYVGGDYWSKTLAFPVGANIDFKIFAGTDGWEQNVTNVGGGNGNRSYTVADVDTVLPVQFFNNGANGRPQYWVPWTEHPDTLNIWFRVNMEGALQNGISCFNDLTDTVGVRGGGPAGGDLNWSPTFYLVREQPASNGGFGYPAGRFWSGRIRMPRAAVTAGQDIAYKFIVGYDWSIPGCANRSEQLPDPPYGGGNRHFTIPVSLKDTTLAYDFYQDARATARANTDTTAITFRANMQRAIATGGFSIGDTVVVRTGYFGTAVQSGREKRLVRQGLSTIYATTDTVITAVNQILDYQYYVIKNGLEVRENYYNFFYAGEIGAEAERRQLTVPGLTFTVEDTATSLTQARRQPIFPNSRTLLRNVDVRWEVDIRPAIYQVRVGGDTLRDIQGSFNVTPADVDSILTWGVWMNGPAVGGWGNPGGSDWGIGLQSNLDKKLYDDGTNGDVTAGDSIFTRQVLASPDSLNIGSKGQVGQTFKFGIRGGDNEGGRGGFGNNHVANIDDSGPTYVLRDQFGSINPAFYDTWDYDCGCPNPLSVSPLPGIPDEYALLQNYPNPFNPSTRIHYAIPAAGLVTLKVFNVLGQEVATLVNEVQGVGSYSASFRVENIPSGVYFYTLRAGEFTSTKKMMVLK
jgi:hypothetical protein